MELSSSNMKKILIFLKMKLSPQNFSLKKFMFFSEETRSEKISYILSKKKLFLYFQKQNPALFSLNSRNKKSTPKKVSYTSGKQKPQKNFLCFLKRKLFLCFGKREPPPQKNFIFRKLTCKA